VIHDYATVFNQSSSSSDDDAADNDDVISDVTSGASRQSDSPVTLHADTAAGRTVNNSSNSADTAITARKRASRMVYAGGEDSSVLHFRVNSKRPEVCKCQMLSHCTTAVFLCNAFLS
jgi:hypothetical protein